MSTLKFWRESGFIEQFVAVHRKQPNKPYCFVLGAGASISSGIPGGGSVAWSWLQELHALEGKGTLDAWLRSGQTGIDDLDPDNVAASYPRIYQRRFEHDPDLGYAWLEDIMRGKRPSFGYSVLADILTKTRHKVVITTNFDNLVADALYTYGGQAPLVCGHESLAGFARANPRRPLVVKVHRDLYLAPKNDERGTTVLDAAWTEALRRLLRTYTPVFIGYGGNDGSLMGFLSQLDPDDIPGTPVWCLRRGDALSDLATGLMEHLRGRVVEIAGFDELMMRLCSALGFSFKDQEMEQRFAQDVRAYRDQVEKLQDAIHQAKRPLTGVAAKASDGAAVAPASGLGAVRSAPAPGEPEKSADAGSGEEAAGASLFEAARASDVREADEALRELVQRASGGWWGVELLARNESDPERRNTIYAEGIKRFPHSAELLGTYANFLMEVRRDHKAAQALYNHALNVDPHNTINLGNYANFLTDILQDHDGAEALYKRALEADPQHANHLGRYADFLMEIRRDHDGAEALYTRALEANSQHADNLGNYTELLLHLHRYAAADALALRHCQVAQPSRKCIASLFRAIAAMARGLDPSAHLAHVKRELAAGQRESSWDFSHLLDALQGELTPEDLALVTDLASTVRGELPLVDLDRHPRWAALGA